MLWIWEKQRGIKVCFISCRWTSISGELELCIWEQHSDSAPETVMSIRTHHSCNNLLSLVLQKKGIYFTVFCNQYCQFILHGFLKVIFPQTCPFRTNLHFKNDLTAFINRQAGYATRVFLLCGCCYRERKVIIWGCHPWGISGTTCVHLWQRSTWNRTS